MNLPWHERIGARLALAVAGVLALLALVTGVLTHLAFERTARTVQATSAAELERLARGTLLEITEREAQAIAASLERHAAATRTVAGYLARRFEDAAPAAPPALVESASGHLLERDAGGVTTLHLPSGAASRPSALRDAGASRALDEVAPSVFAELEDGVGLYLLTPDGVTRYHPPIEMHRLVAADFDPTVQPVYRLGTPAANPGRETRWTAPYLDDVGNGLLVTAVTPVYAGGAFRGVVDVDVSLARLAERLAGLSPLPGSFALLVDGEGRLVSASPGATARLGLAEAPALGAPLEGADALARLGGDGAGLVPLDAPGEALVLAHAPLPGTGWTLAIGAPVSVVDASARQIAAGIADEARRARRGNAVAGVVAFLVALLVLVSATRRWVVRPIAGLAAAARRLGSGELGVAPPSGPRGEFRVLGEAFGRMSRTLAHQRAEILAHQRDLERQVGARTRELGNLLAISADMSAMPDLPSLVGSVLERLRDAVPFARGSVWLLEDAALRRIAVAPVADATPGVVPAAVLDRLPGGREARRPVRLPAGFEAPLGAPDAATLVAPLAHRGRLSGVLVLVAPEVDEAHRVDLVAAVAGQLARALENARLLHAARERSALEERQHLARELHDSVSQALFGVVLGLQTARKEIDAPGRLRDAVDYAGELADAALKEMRALIFELRPESLEAEGVSGLLRRQAEMLRARHELEVELDVEEPPLPLEAKAVLYRVTQEALHNVVKHARARTVRVALAERDGIVRLAVRDDGRGFTEEARGGESFGLASMHERMALLGGRLEVRSAPGAGTTVAAELPLPASAWEPAPA